MAQVTIYLDNSLEQKIKKLAKKAGVSISKFISKNLENSISDKWSEDVKDLQGTWDDIPMVDSIRSNDGFDIQREKF